MDQVKQVLLEAANLRHQQREEEAQKLLEESLSTLKQTNNNVWELAKYFAQWCLDRANYLLTQNQTPEAFELLKKAREAIDPMNQPWRKKLEWKLVKVSVLRLFAEYYQRYALYREFKT